MPARWLAALCLAPLGAGCLSYSLTHEKLDGLLEGQNVRGIVREPSFTLWSPYDTHATRTWVAVVAEERAAVLGAFGGEAEAERLQIVLRPVQGMGPQFASAPDGGVMVQHQDGDPTRGLRGWAGERSISLHVPAQQWLRRPDGESIPSSASPEGHRRDLRHELAHWRAFALGIEGGEWLEEGLAQLVEGLELEEGRLVDRGLPHGDVLQARGLRVGELSLVELLDWREDGRSIVEIVHSGEEERELGVEPVPRTACGLYVRFLLDLRGDGVPVEDLGARLHALGRLSRAEHLAGEARWRAWLADELAQHASAATAR